MGAKNGNPTIDDSIYAIISVSKLDTIPPDGTELEFELANGKVKSVTTKQNEFVEIDPYTFVKK